MEALMEFNGVSNMRMILELGLQDQAIDFVLAQTLNEQLILLERYMNAINKSIEQVNRAGAMDDIQVEIPAWHEVKANPTQFPTQREEALNEKKD